MNMTIMPQKTSNSVLKTKTEVSLAGAASCATAAVGIATAATDASLNSDRIGVMAISSLQNMATPVQHLRCFAANETWQ